MEARRVVLISCSDLHLSHRPPIARSVEDDWFAAQKRGLKQLSLLGKKHQCPIVCCGDIFDRWNSPPELINFAISNLPTMYSVHGNHDTPEHNSSLLFRSAYHTLVEVGRLIPLNYQSPVEVNVNGIPICLHGFPFGTKVTGLTNPHDLVIEIACVHDFIWTKTTGYEGGAPKDKRLRAYESKLKGYDFACFGDNHHRFKAKIGTCQVVNTGTFQRRKADEKECEPAVALLFSDGTAEWVKLDTSQDQFVDNEKLAAIISEEADVQGLVDELNTLADADVDFESAVRAGLEQVSEGAKTVVLEAMGSD